MQADMKRGKGRGHVSAAEMRNVARPCGKQPDAQCDKGASVERKPTHESQHNMCLMPSGADDHDSALIDPYGLDTLDPYALETLDPLSTDAHAEDRFPLILSDDEIGSAYDDTASTYMESPSLSGLVYMTRCRML